MEEPTLRAPVRHLRLLTSLTLVFVVAIGLFAFLRAPEAAPDDRALAQSAGWAIVLLFFVSLANVAIARFLMLPALASRGDSSPGRIAVMAFLLSLTPAIYGMISAALSGEGALSLPFTLLSLLAAAELWAHFSGAYERIQPSPTAGAAEAVEVPIRSSDHGADEPLS